MKNILGEKCYTGAEIADNLGEPYTIKRIEYMRNLGLLPSPIKINSGDGTKGYYPEDTIKYLREIDRLHKQGKSYPELVPHMKERISTFTLKISTMKNDYQATKTAKKYVLTCSSSPLGAMVDPVEGCDSKIKDAQNELKTLFARKDSLSPAVLLQIKSIIEDIQSQETIKRVILDLRMKLRGHMKK